MDKDKGQGDALKAVLQACAHAADAADAAGLHDAASAVRAVTDGKAAFLVTTRALRPCREVADAGGHRLQAAAPWRAMLAAQMAADLHLRYGTCVNVFAACRSAEHWARTARGEGLPRWDVGAKGPSDV